MAYCNAAANPRFASTTSQDPTQAAYVFGTPLSLNQCSDVYVLPHADPSLWPARYKTTLINFVSTGGALCQACHSVSDLEVNVTRCLSTGLILYEAHSNGMLPYIDDPTA